MRFVLRFFLAFFPLVLLFSTSAVYAQEEKFETSSNISYTVSENGTTQVVQNITLKNKTDEYRASEYTLEVGLADLKNIQARDPEGPIVPKIEKIGEKTQIRLAFNQFVVGKEKALPFYLSFETTELAEKKGLIWEVNIPGLEEKTSFTEYNVTLVVPQSFGEPAFVKPAKSYGGGKLTWRKEEIPKGGILAVFGEFQIYRFSLKYHLKNPRFYPIQTEIALPPQTNYQKILINRVGPAPLNVRIDQDGNWLASFKLFPQSSLTAEVNGTAQVFLMPRSSEREKLGEGMKRNYLSSQKYWEIEDKTIHELARFLKTPENIYNFVVRELTYDLKRVEKETGRVGAKGVLQNKNSAICMEFTDLFIALARAAGIPAREINGWALAENSELRPLSLVRDILHAWPEYYDEKRGEWRMVDPTWGNTTGGLDYFNILDFNHLTFAIKGKSSEYPIPAGGYKIDGREDSKDIEVEFESLENINSIENSEINLTSSPKILSFSPVTTTLLIENKGNTLIEKQTLEVSTQGLSPSFQTIETGKLPPFGKQEITLKFKKNSLFQREKVIIEIKGAGDRREFEVLISPFPSFSREVLLIIVGGGLLGVLFILLTRKAWRLSLQGQKRSNSLRGKGQ